VSASVILLDYGPGTVIKYGTFPVPLRSVIKLRFWFCNTGENKQEKRFLCLVGGVEEGDNGGQLLGASDDGQPPLVQAQAQPLQQRRRTLPVNTGHLWPRLSINQPTNQSINTSEIFQFCSVKDTSSSVPDPSVNKVRYVAFS
jgi:hypothetical protein